jgi:hypothetical protein
MPRSKPPTLEQVTQKRSRFLVYFINTDLQHLEPGGLAAIKSGLADFLSPVRVDAHGPVMASIDVLPSPEALGLEALVDLQRGLGTFVRQIVASRRGGPRAQIAVQCRLMLFPLQPLRAPARIRRGRSFLVQAWGDTATMTYVSVASLMSLEGGAPILVCPECGALFVRHRRQRYCSAACTLRANQRTWRASVAGKAAEAARKRRRYAEKLEPVRRARLEKRRTAQARARRKR